MRRRYAGLSLLALGLLLAAHGWAGWMDPLIDFGRELYVPWRIHEGQILYRDMVYLDGPLSPYLNALFFAAAGVSLRTLEIANLGVLCIAGSLLFALVRRLGDELAGFASVALFLSAFAFNLIGTGGNMNWLNPYSHGVTHGLTLALLSLWLFARWQEGTRGALALSGLALGLCGLTKPEIFAAAGLALGGGVVATALGRPRRARRLAVDLAVVGAATALPFLVSFALLAAAMPASRAAEGTLGGWPHLLGSDVSGLYFYRWLMGIDVPRENLLAMGHYGLLWILPLLPATAVALIWRGASRARTIAAASLAALWPLVWLLARSQGSDADWGEVTRPLTPFAALFTAGAVASWWREPSGPGSAIAALRLAFALLSLLLLAKIFLQPVLWGYGFALAVPAAALLVVALLDTIPKAIARRGGHAWTFRATALALLVTAGLGALTASEAMRARKTVWLGEGRDRFRTDRQVDASRIVKRLVEGIEKNLPADATLVVLPEGVIVNYLARRPNPTPHLNFVPPEIAIFGEERILRDLTTNPPDYVVLVQRDTREYGLPLFGTHYARSLLRWARRDYELVARAGATPLVMERLEDHLPGFEVRRRRAP